MGSVGRLKFGTLFFLLITVGLIYLAILSFPPWMDYFAFKSAMAEKAKDGGILSTEEILKTLNATANELKIPLKEGAIQIDHRETEMSISASWDIEATMVGNIAFTLHFSPQVTEHYR